MKAGSSLRTDLLARVGIRLTAGYARFYSGTQPADSDTALAGNTLIAQCSISSYLAAGGILALTLGSATVAAAGTPTFARFYQNGGSGVTGSEFDMTVGSDLSLSKADWTASETFPGMTVNIQLPVGS